MSQQQGTPHARAASESLRRAGWYILTTLGQLMLRCLAFSPLIYALSAGKFLGLEKQYTLGAALLCSLLLWLLLVLPERYRLGGVLSGWFGGEVNHGSYPQRLKLGLLRFLRVSPLVLPILLVLYAVYHVFTFLGFPDFFKMLETPGKLAVSLLSNESGDLSLMIGIGIWALGMAVLVWLAVWGWRRYLSPSFYLPAGERAARKGTALRQAYRVNALIALPPFLVVLALLGISLAPKMSGSMMFDVLTIVTAITQFDFPQSSLLYCGLVLLIGYLPFVLYRKAAIAAGFHGGR